MRLQVIGGYATWQSSTSGLPFGLAGIGLGVELTTAEVGNGRLLVDIWGGPVVMVGMGVGVSSADQMLKTSCVIDQQTDGVNSV